MITESPESLLSARLYTEPARAARPGRGQFPGVSVIVTQQVMCVHLYNEYLTTCLPGRLLHRVRGKKSLQYFRHIRQITADFQNSFTFGISLKFAVKLSLNIPPHLKRVTTLPCEILMSDN